MREDARDLAIRIARWHVDEINEALLHRVTGFLLEEHRHLFSDERLTRLIHALEDFEKSLARDFGNRFTHRLTQQLTMAHELVVTFVHELKHEFRAVQNSEERR